MHGRYGRWKLERRHRFRLQSGRGTVVHVPSTCDGLLVAIEVAIFAISGNAVGTLRLFEGDPATGTEVPDAAPPFTFPGAGMTYRVELVAPVAVLSDQTYAYLFDSDKGSPLGGLILLANEDPYAGGSAYEAFLGNPPQARTADDLGGS